MKLKFIIAFFITFFTPIQASLIATGVLLVIDTIAGVIAAKKRGERVTSKKLKMVVVKMFLYQITIITGHILELYFIGYIPFTQIVLGGIATTEFFSILENVSSITGKSLLVYVKGRLEGLLNKNKKIDGDKK